MLPLPLAFRLYSGLQLCLACRKHMLCVVNKPYMSIGMP